MKKWFTTERVHCLKLLNFAGQKKEQVWISRFYFNE